MKANRGKEWLTNAEYRRVQREYLTWIDSRVTAGHTLESMNRELEMAGLFPRSPKSPDEPGALDELYASHAGYAEAISTKSVGSRLNIFVLAVGMYRGAGCSLDVTAAIYQRNPLRRVAIVNGDSGESHKAYYLSAIAAGEQSPGKGQIIASGWVVSNCTSTWNGKRIRIDRLNGASVAELLARNLAAQDRNSGEAVSVSIEQDAVSFRYNGAVGDGDLLSGPSIARYRLMSDRAILEVPIALTRVGFIHEWLSMSDADANRWSEPKASLSRSAAASDLKHGFGWERTARCAGSVWEIAVRANESKKLEVFRIAGSRATDLRILAVSSTVSAECVATDLPNGLAAAANELPW